ncbi:MAG: hypothetical protein ACLR71_14565 [[Clostridium] scindens]
MHDIHTESVDAALALIPKLIDEGYQLVTVSEMARAKGVELKDGVKFIRISSLYGAEKEC